MRNALHSFVVILMALAIVFYLTSVSGAHTSYYVGPAATGSGSGVDRSNLLAIETFEDTTSTPGDTALLQPGNYKPIGSGWYKFSGEGTTNVGTSWTDPITYQVDTGAPGYEPMPADWFDRQTDVPAADPSKHCVFGGIEFTYYRSGGDWASALPYYIILDGLWLDNEVYFYSTVAHVRIKHCVIALGNTSYSSTTKDYGLEFRHVVGSDSDVHDIKLEDCYIRGSTEQLSMKARIRAGDVTFDHVRGTQCSGSAIGDKPYDDVKPGYLIIEDSKFDNYVSVADDGSAPVTRTIEEVDPAQPRRHFRVNSDVSSTYLDFVDFTHGGTGQQGITATPAFDHGTLWVTLTADAPWDLVAGSDVPRFYDNCHGSGWHVAGNNTIIRRTQFINQAATATVYCYRGDGGGPTDGASNITVEDCLFYSLENSTWGVCFGGAYNDMGDNFTFRGNTLIGWYDPSLDNNHPACHYYGRALIIEANGTANLATWNVSNNLVVGLWQGVNLGAATRCSNIVYARGTPFPYTPTGDLAWAGGATNEGNVVIYAGEPWGSEPHPFHKAGTYFVAAGDDFDTLFTTVPSTYNAFSDLHLKAGSPAIGAGSTTYKTTTDIDGQLRGSPPDVGCDEFCQGATQYLFGLR